MPRNWLRQTRTLAVLYGVGLALLVNALPVLLTFDLDAVVALYDRAEGANAVIVLGVFLFHAVYLRRVAADA